MRRVFNEELAEIHRDILQLGRMTNEAIYKSVKSLVNHNAELAQEVIDKDKHINEKENKIDRKCYEIIALQQPNASDLRRVISVMRISSDLERMGDHAENISKVTVRMDGEKKNLKLEQSINQMGDKINSMCSDIIDAFLEFDVDKAIFVAKRDTEIDHIYHDLRSSIIESVREDPDAVLTASDYSFVGMHLERIGDYIKNIGEWIVYLDTGEITDLD